MPVNLNEAVQIAKREVQKEGFELSSFCVESPEGWYFDFADKITGIIPPGFPGFWITRNGVFKRDFNSCSSNPVMPIQNGHEIDISEYLKD